MCMPHICPLNAKPPNYLKYTNIIATYELTGIKHVMQSAVHT